MVSQSTLWLLLLAGLFTAPAAVPTKENVAPDMSSATFLKKHESGGQEFEAGFVPDKTDVVLGEPLKATFTLKNTSKNDFDYWFGGDYRGTGRHDRFKISARDGIGNLLPDPKALPDGTVPDFGGLVQICRLKPGETNTKIVDLTHFRRFDKPGSYRIECRFGVHKGSMSPHKDELAFTVTTAFQLVIAPRSAANVARVQRQLMVQALQSSGATLADTIGILCTFAQEAAVPDLLKLAATGDQEHRIAALRGLGRFSVDPAEVAALKALRDPDELIRAAAAEALGAINTEAAIAALVERWNGEKPAVASAMLGALGRSKSPLALAPLHQALTRQDKYLQDAAIAGLVEFGAQQAIATLKTFTTDKDMGRRESVLTALCDRLGQPLDVATVRPLVDASRDYPGGPRGRNPNPALRLVRMYSGVQAAPELIRFLDFDDPSPKSGYNFWIVHHLTAVPKAPQVSWHHDPNRAGTPQELADNRAILARLRQWLANYDKGGQGADSK